MFRTMSPQDPLDAGGTVLMRIGLFAIMPHLH